MALDITIRSATVDDAQTIAQMARVTWMDCYPALIPVEQIEYMLGWMYARETIAWEIDEGIRYVFAEVDGEPAGFSSYGPLQDVEVVQLHKIYVLPAWYGKGLGHRLMEHVFEEVRKAGASAVQLRVNRNNERAVRAYRRYGFAVLSEDCKDIGHGFVMDDFVMECAVS